MFQRFSLEGHLFFLNKILDYDIMQTTRKTEEERLLLLELLLERLEHLFVWCRIQSIPYLWARQSCLSILGNETHGEKDKKQDMQCQPKS